MIAGLAAFADVQVNLDPSTGASAILIGLVIAAVCVVFAAGLALSRGIERRRRRR